MTFSQQVKEELCRNAYDTNQKKAILSAFLKNVVAINISNNKIDWEIKGKVPLTIRFIGTLLNELYSIKKDVYISDKKYAKMGRSYKLEFHGDFNLMEKELHIFENPIPYLLSDETKAAYLIGVFLGGGSINNPSSSSYHFELSIHNEDLMNDIQQILKHFHIKYSFIERKNKYIIYVKKSELISDILKIMGASNCMFEFEEKRIYRDYSNQMSRLNNLDMSNLKKTVLASHQQTIYINFIKEKGLLNRLSDKEIKFCELRMENEDASLNELVRLFKIRYNIEVSKPGINHMVRKIKKIYDENT